MKKIKLILQVPQFHQEPGKKIEPFKDAANDLGLYEFIGESIGSLIESPSYIGEIVFNTSMTGYQEVISDPSYCQQIIVMTYPLIGNYGINKDDFESLTPSLAGLVVKECAEKGSHWKNEYSLSDFLKKHEIPGISQVDTRKITKMIRLHGTLKACLAPLETSLTEVRDIFSRPLPSQQVKQVSLQNPIHFPGRDAGKDKRIVLMDFGYKKNILHSLLQRDCDVVVVPWNTPFDKIRSYSPKGILLSNGPGDPTDLQEILPTIVQLQNHYPLFAICLGHQLFALANGAKTEKMKFGHRGANHPVKDLQTGRVHMSSQNHGYTVTTESLIETNLQVTQINLNDQTIEGLKHKSLPAFSVQYHPEANPGPLDLIQLFDEFIEMI